MQEFASTRVGIDVFGWLHRGIYTCASKLCRGIDTNGYVEYCMHRVRMLIYFHITPVLVFDGAELPMKTETHDERRARREEAYAKAEAAYAAGEFRKAEEFYQRACPVTHEMVRDVIRQCRSMNVEYVVAPYEADAQLAWMMMSGYIDSVITEDSDLLVYGASKIFYKMSKDGQGELFQRKNLPSLDIISLNNFTDDMFVYMCVCAGCDFFKGVNGLGIRKAHPIVRRHRTLERLIHAIRLDSKFKVSQSFTVDFARACLVFRHQTVLDMRTRKTVPLRKLDDLAISALPHGVVSKLDNGSRDLDFLGRFLDSDVAKRLSEGFVNPRTLKEYEDPLDIVERPVAPKKQRSFTTPSKKASVSEKKKSVKGFMVQPALQARSQTPPQTAASPSVQRATSLYKTVPNLRQRLSSGSASSSGFDPRREARRFSLKNRSSATPNPLLSSSSVWSKFKRASAPNTMTVSTSDAPSRQESLKVKEININRQEVCDVMNKSVRNAEALMEDGLEMRKAQEQPSLKDDSPVPKRPRKLAPRSSNCVQAVNKVIGKFATVPSEKMMKFCSAERPPSPDHNSFKLFDEIDEQARDNDEDTLKSLAAKTGNNDGSKLLKASNFTPPQSKKQLRVSRFFASSQGAEQSPKPGGATNDQNVPVASSPSARVKAAMNGLGWTERRQAQKRKIDNFRRAASGKKIRASPDKTG